jgi:hypothetical protein
MKEFEHEEILGSGNGFIKRRIYRLEHERPLPSVPAKIT